MGVYDHTLRVLTCPACGAPLDVPPGGGQAHCGYCGQTSMFDPRPAGPKPHARAPADPARLERLRAQQGAQEQPPVELLPFLSAPLSGPRLEQAVTKAAQLRAAPKSEARDLRIHWLTLALYNAYAGPENARHQRAAIESATESLCGSERTAVLLGMLARNAARAGEVPAARGWISQMNPSAESLTADSAYRLTHAYVDTAAGEFESVLAMLGPELGEIPLAGGDTLMSAVLRANAHEQLGESPSGAAQLAYYMKQDPKFRALIDRIIEANASLSLCAEGIQLARTVLDRQ